MNKQLLLGEIELDIYELSNDRAETAVGSIEEKYCDYHLKLLDKYKKLVNQLDEPKKEVVPQDVADFIEDGNRYDKIAFLVHQKYLGINSLMRECPVKDWLRSVDYKTVLSLVNGYEVEKEQLYRIPLPNLITSYGEQQFLSFDENNSNYFASRKRNHLKQTFTLSEIEDMPEEYKKFAVKVEEEHERD